MMRSIHPDSIALFTTKVGCLVRGSLPVFRRGPSWNLNQIIGATITGGQHRAETGLRWLPEAQATVDPKSAISSTPTVVGVAIRKTRRRDIARSADFPRRWAFTVSYPRKRYCSKNDRGGRHDT